MSNVYVDLPDLQTQVDTVVALGLHRRIGLTAAQLHESIAGHAPTGALLAVHPTLLTAAVLAPLLERHGKPGFVVEDMTDVDAFAPIEGAGPPSSPLYLVEGIERGDQMANWSPDEALPAITGRGRTPLTLIEGIMLVLQSPDTLERNHCFMTIGSRLTKANGTLDARTPALWISNGTGRDGSERRHAPKVGWCWAGNRHTWLGFASAHRRQPLP